MPISRCGAALVLAGVLAASPGCGGPCAGQSDACPARPAGGRAAPDDMVCIQEPQTGSHIVETRCYRRDALDERREADRAILEKALIRGNQPRRGTRDQ